jgi:hypothetical protein
MPSLGDIENTILMMLSEPGANFVLGQGPSWSSLTNPQYSQALLDYFINLAYKRVASDLADYNLLAAKFTITTSTGVGTYSIPPTGVTIYPELRLLRDVFYLPLGVQNAVRFEPGSMLVSWSEFCRKTGQNYLRANSGTLYPTYCALGSQRNTLELFPTPLETGDIITVYYSALPTPNANQFPTLVAVADMIALPSDCVEAMTYWALWYLYKRNGDDANARFYRQTYAEEIARLKVIYGRDSIGDFMQITGDPTYSPVNDLSWAGL